MFLLKSLKYIKVALTIAVFIMGVFVLGTTSTEANFAKKPDRLLETASCLNGNEDCVYAFCINDGFGCSFWTGACFYEEGGYC